MAHCIPEKTVRTLIVEPSDVKRTMLAVGMRELGFRNVKATRSIAEALALIESDEEMPEWILSPLLGDEPVNALNMLTLCIKEPALHACRVSLFLAPDERDCLVNAFELGLFSCHDRSSDVGSQLLRVEELSQICERYAGDDCLIAAHYLRAHLAKSEMFRDLLRLDTAMLALFPKSERCLLQLAEALFLNDRPQVALMALARAPELQPEAAETARRLIDQITTASGFTSTGEVQFAARHGLRCCVVVDPDGATVKLLGEALRALGVPRIETFGDGEAAWEFLRTAPEPDLIIQEWRLPKLSGSLLIQRLRSKGRAMVPIIVYSSVVKGNIDHILLRELGVTDVLEKPKPLKQLIPILCTIVKEHLTPHKPQSAVLRIRRLLMTRDFAAAQNLFEELNRGPGTLPEALRLHMLAELAFHQGRYVEAGYLAAEALQTGGEDLLVLNLLGKTYTKLRQFEQAQAFFSRATAICPQNIERLCQLAQVQSELGLGAAAAGSLDRARSFDGQSETVAEAGAKIALVRGDTEGAKELLTQLESFSGVIAFMNNRAVALALQGKWADGIAMYERTLAAMPEEMGGLKSMVSFNLGLGLVKSGDLAAAKAPLAAAVAYDCGPVTAKARSLLKRLERSLATGEPLKLNTGEGGRHDEGRDEEMATPEPRTLPVALDVELGTMRCHLVFHSGRGVEARVAMLIAASPRFAMRPSILRGKTGSKKAAY